MRWLSFTTDELVSPLSLAECTAQLRAVVQSEWMIFGSSKVVGHVGEKSFRLRKRLHRMRNSFQTYLFAKLTSEGASTRLTCRSGPHPFVIVFMIIWFGGVTAGAVGTLGVGLRQAGSGTMPSAFLLIPWAMVVFGIGLVGVGRRMARGERQFLLDFLRETIAAQPSAPHRTTKSESVVQR